MQLDMRGKPCPLPVVHAKKALEKTDGIIVLVDNLLAVQNLEKMAKGKGYVFSHSQKNENDFTVSMGRQGSTAACETESPQSPAAKSASEGAIVLISSEKLGSGSDELGKILMKGFLFSLTELPLPPRVVIFINSGVHLAAEGSNTLADLQTLCGKGSKVLACGTCLNYYALTEKLAVGEVVDMFTIAGFVTTAEKLISL